MPVNILRPFSSPSLRRDRDTIMLETDGASKCAEIFVTNNADKWTFFCNYCQMAANDIGVFICHIRLEHLNVRPDSARQSNNTKRPEEIFTNSQQQSALSDIIKEESTVGSNQEDLQAISLTENNESMNLIACKNSTQTSQDPGPEMNQSVFTIIPIDRQQTQKQLRSESNTEAINEFEKDDEIYDDLDIDNDDADEDDGDDMDSESNDDNEASGSKTKIMRKSKSLAVDSDISPVKCPYCTIVFKTKHSAAGHIIRNHDKELPIKCEKCQRGFLSTNGLKIHIKYHDANKHKECPVCKTEHLEVYFITHVLTHEGDKCFPCQVCGEIYTSYYERLKHWNTHAKEKPFACSICYRRYSKLQYLRRHLKSHNQYECNFCSLKFNSSKAQRYPYVCTECEELPDIKQKIEHLNSLLNHNDALDLEKNVNITSNPVDEFLVIQDTPDKQPLTQEAFAEIKLKPHSYSSFVDDDNNGSNTNLSYDKYHSDNDDVLNEYDSNLAGTDDTLDKTQPSTVHKNAEFLPKKKRKYIKKDLNSEKLLKIRKNQIGFKYKCPQCQREFQSRSTLCQHVKAHDKKNLLKCPVCPSRIFGEGLFIAHVMSHENDTCFPCQVCGKIFEFNEERITHWKTHIKERPYDCKICYRRFAQKPILTRHMKSHKQ
ncbi:zinc finger protein 717-like [Calliphora vicina]|uniref:zinc finger protein 717-like n=1 Tax=Calliphora vicina TaxID=7373 RepID=UPI00325A7E55